ncbi:hypothetical protein Tco_0597132 [Tanacetum coccineum]
MIIENLDFEPKINAMMRDFLKQVLETSPCLGERFTLMLLEHQDMISEFRSPSLWKELSKETGSKILLSGDGSCRKTFKPIASLNSERKIEIKAGAISTEVSWNKHVRFDHQPMCRIVEAPHGFPTGSSMVFSV